MAPANWLDRTISVVAPRWQLQRVRARIATDLMLRHYEAAAVGRRTQGWQRTSGDANSVNGNASLSRLRDLARDLVRNNGQMAQALRTIANHTVGWGVMAKPMPANPRVSLAWKAWAETTACDADGRDDLYGLQKLIMRGVAESGEMLVRRRIRRLEDGLPIPLQLQVLEPDLLDASKTVMLPTGGQIIQGVEFDPIGNRVAYWMFPSHPGATLQTFGTLFPAARRIPASEILHVYQRDRAGQVRAVSWFAPIILPAKDLDEYADAQLMKQKIAACLAVVTSDIDGSAPPLGTADDTQSPGIDTLSPGAVLNLPPGRNVSVVQPPNVNEYGPYMTTETRRLAKGLGVSYEDFAGDYSQVNFSSARMARLSHYENVYDWRWRLLVPQFCDPVWSWAMQALQILGSAGVEPPRAQWTAPPIPMIEPDKEGLAIQRNVRTGIQTMPDALRERGVDPDEYLEEQREWNAKVDAAGLKLDSDPRFLTQAGQLQGDAAAPPTAARDAAIDAQFAAVDRDLVGLRAAVLTRDTPKITINNQMPDVTVGDTTVHVPPTETRIEAPITVQPATAPHIDVTTPVTVAPAHIDVHMPPQRPMRRQVTKRDAVGRPEEIVETPVDEQE